jgi:hypothetical protein
MAAQCRQLAWRSDRGLMGRAGLGPASTVEFAAGFVAAFLAAFVARCGDVAERAVAGMAVGGKSLAIDELPHAAAPAGRPASDDAFTHQTSYL